jgi:hypothetical protein
MKRLKTLIAVFILIALTLTIAGCGLIGAYRANSDISDNQEQDLPEWLTVAHRVQMETLTVEESEENGLGLEAERTPVVNQPASTQPGSTQPEQPAPTSGTPRWQQPGTMEYIAKQQLDQLAFNYKKLNTTIADLEEKTDKDENEVADLKSKKLDRKNLYETMSDAAGGIGLNLEKEYGIKAPPADSTAAPSSTWFNDWEHSPTGFGN